MLPVFRCTFELREHHKILRFQIVQEAAGKIVVLLVVTEAMSASEISKLKAGLHVDLGGSVRIELQFVDCIANTGLKHSCFVSRIPSPELPDSA